MAVAIRRPDGLGMVGEVGLEPTKLKAADLQSAPFATRDTPPYFYNENRGLNPVTG